MSANKKTSKSGRDASKTAPEPPMSANKKSHSGPTVSESRRADKGQRKRLVRLDDDTDDRLQALLDSDSGLTLAGVMRAGVEAIEQNKTTPPG